MNKMAFEDVKFQMELKKERDRELAYVYSCVLAVVGILLMIIAVSWAGSSSEKPCFAEVDGVKLQIECK